jgi:DNA repair photolyase
MAPVARVSGRGTAQNPENRYERIHIEPDETGAIMEDEAVGVAQRQPQAPTIFYRDTSRSALAKNDSPDIGFRFSLNPYRGCEHGCIYCYARPTHEYLSFSAGLDFERRIMVKHDAPELLRQTFLSPRWQPQTVALSGNTDCYQPVERLLQLTRRCLEVFREFLNPVGIVTKSALVTRDIDLLGGLAEHGAAHVCVSVTSLDGELARRMEPRAAQPDKRIEAIAQLSAAGIPTAVLIAPVIPGLNDEEMPRIIRAAAAAGACSAGWVLLRLPKPVDALFENWLAEQFPARRARVLGRIRECRDGRLSDAHFGKRMRGEGVYAAQIGALFAAATRRHGLQHALPPLNAGAFRRPPRSGEQLRLC